MNKLKKLLIGGATLVTSMLMMAGPAYASGITEISSDGFVDIADAWSYTNGTPVPLTATITGATSGEHVTWSIASSDQAYATIVDKKCGGSSESGECVSTAKIQITGMPSDGKVTVIAKNKAGDSKTVDIAVKRAAEFIELTPMIYTFNKTTETYSVYTEMLDTYFDKDNKIIYLESGYYLGIVAQSYYMDGTTKVVASDDPVVRSMNPVPTEKGSTPLKLENTGLLSVRNGNQTKLNLTTNSGQVSDNYNIVNEIPVQKFSISVENNTEALTFLQGDKVTATVVPEKVVIDGTKVEPTDSYNWDYSKSTVYKVATDFQADSNGKKAVVDGVYYGSANLVCTVNDGHFSKRTSEAGGKIQVRYPVTVIKKIPYLNMELYTEDNIKISEDNDFYLVQGGSLDIYLRDSGVTDTDAQPNEHILWTSSNTNVLKVTGHDNYVSISAAKDVSKLPKRVTLTASNADGSKSKTVTIYVYVPATKITTDVNILQIPVGQQASIKYTVDPGNCDETGAWSIDSVDNSYLRVVSNKQIGETGEYELVLMAKAVKSGANGLPTTIDVSGESSQKTVRTTVKVTVVPSIPVEKLSLSVSDKLRIEKDSDGNDLYCIEAGSSVGITAEPTPADTNDTFKWTYEVIEQNSYVDELTGEKVYLSPFSSMEIAGGSAKLKLAENPGIIKVTCTALSGVKSVTYIKSVISATSNRIYVDGKNIKSVAVQKGEYVYLYSELSTGTTDTVKWSVVADGVVDTSAVKFSKKETKSGDVLSVTASKTGKYRVRATATGGVLAELEFNVVIPTESLDFLDENSKNINDGIALVPGTERVAIKLGNIQPADTTDKPFSWSIYSGKNTIIEIDEISADGTTVYINTIAPGTDYLKVVTIYKTFTLKVKVVVPATSLKLNGADELEPITMIMGRETAAVEATLTPSGSATYKTTDEVTWSVSKEGIIEITKKGYTEGPTQNISIKAVGEGDVTVTASTVSGLKKNFVVKVRTTNLNDESVEISMRDYSYTGAEQTPDPASIRCNGRNLYKDTDYIITGYENNTEAGTATVILEGIGNYSGVRRVTFNINKVNANGSNPSVEYNAYPEFTGKAVKPAVTITYGDIKLAEGVDYVLNYGDKDNISFGTYYFEITYIKNFAGTISKSYRISQKDISGITFKNNKGTVVTTFTSEVYTGSAITKVFSVYDGKNPLEEGIDYSVRYEGNVDAGTATIIVAGKGNYTGSASATFTITPFALSKTAIEVTNQTYSATTAWTPSVNVTRVIDGVSKSLYKGSDYIITWANNEGTGYCKLTISMGSNGNYTGSRTIYTVAPTTISTVTNVSTGSKLVWTKNSGATGYKVYRRVVGTTSWTLLKTITSNTTLSYIDTTASGKGDCEYMVKTYKTVAEKTYLSVESNISSSRYLAGTSVSSLASTEKGVLVKWTKNSAASGYIIYRSVAGAAYEKLTTIRDNTVVSYEDNTANINGKKYQYKIVPYISARNDILGVETAAKTIFYLKAPAIVTMTTSAKGTYVKWEKNASSTGYILYRKAGSGAWAAIKTFTENTQITYTDTEAKTNGTHYYYKVVAVKTVSSTEYKSYASAISETYYLAAVAPASLTSSTTGITVKWARNASVTGYKLYRSIAGGEFTLIRTTTTNTEVSYKDTEAVNNGKKYMYKLIPYKTVSGKEYTGFSGASKTAYYLTASNVSAVENLSSAISVKWNRNAGATGYKVYRSVDGASFALYKTISDNTVVSFTDTAVTNGKKYQYKITCYKTVSGTTYMGIAGSVKTIYRVTVPTNLTVTNPSAGKALVKWDKNSACTGYVIQYKTGTTIKTATITSAATLSKYLSSLTKGSTYNISIRAYKTVSGVKYYSAWSASKSIKITK